MRRERRLSFQKKKKRWPKVLAAVLIGLVVAGGLCVVFFPQLNNTVRNATGNDTAADTVVKNELVKQIEARKTGDATVDAKLDAAATTLKNTKMSRIVAAAGDQAQMTSLLKTTTGASTNQATAAANLLFANDALQPVREAVAAGDWVKAYQAYKSLNGTEAFTEFKADLGQY
ncbi:hypothetical protein [Lacticaseibacillus daqingensis]|uniref:hypothetical protein n=1 Tax=Lacticaseibacillus daqingensis TaxID=2486014 RepID=UPI000F776D52|nr:hypothetical protein [Lacticaseibacillus daqingensis]